MEIICNAATTASSIESNGITWTLDASYTVGQFVSGDWYVVAPSGLTVTAVSPGWSTDKNGSMVDPSPSSTVQGYDNRTMNFTYDASVRATFPLLMAANSSLVSTIGKTTPAGGGGATRISAAAVLTVLSTAPAANAFRPPYVGTTKTIWTTADVNYNLLPGLTTPVGATLIDMSASGDYLNKIWLSHGNQLTWHAQIHPEDHMGGASLAAKGYPFEMCKRVNRMALACLLDIPEAQSIANRLIQYGIDLYPSLSGNSMTWSRPGGFGQGRKWPILFAKTMLGASWTIPYYVTGSSGMEKFQEDSHTYIGTASEPRWGEICDASGYPGSYSGSNHACRAVAGDYDQWELGFLSGQPQGDGGLYEVANSGKVWAGAALAARLMETAAGTKTAWGNQTFFDYVDRYVAPGGIAEEVAASGLVSGSGLTNDFQIDVNKYGGTGNGFMKKMWETYR